MHCVVMGNGRVFRSSRNLHLFAMFYVFYLILYIFLSCNDCYNGEFQNGNLSNISQDGTKRQCLLKATIHVKRSRVPITLYNNSTATFRAIIQLVHDIELNPGPNHSVNHLQEKANSRITIAHLNVHLLKSRDHFVLVKESILANKFDVFTNLGSMIP
jgi:hypothetical protein